MLTYIVRRIVYMIPTLFVISVLIFFIIQLPPGDFLTTVQARLAERGEEIDMETLAALEERYGLSQPFHVQYWKWISGILFRGDFGRSFDWERPVSELIWARLSLTFLISFCSLLFVWVVSFPVGIYSAIKKYSIGDYIATFIGFLGLAIPDFLFALVILYIAFAYFGQSVGGLFSPEFADAPWSWAKLKDLGAHLIVPLIVLAPNGTAGLIRIMRNNLLDELPKAYVTTARAKGLSERRLLFKYPVRVAANPFISTVGWVLPSLISGAAIVSIVLNLPTTGPLLLNSLLNQDMYLAGSFLLILSVLTVIGTLISDILLAWLDPRIRYE